MGLLIYTIGVVDNIIKASIAFGVVLVLVGGFAAIGLAAEDELEDFIKNHSKLVKKMAVAIIVSFLIAVLTPSSKTLAAMYLVPKMANSETAETISKMPNKALKILEAKLDEYIEDSLPTKK